ncbi:MAG: sigma-70 family RNA polymerase sigma factor, partial [bacterium]|nr:sigma-70 family RNA polymerase sigma factor [bacterium]
MNRAEDYQFERYCRTGATDALAAAFDATAPELWRVAWYLAGGARHLAEDALQAPFRTAIEDRARWDESRPLRQWLLGILANHVRNH